jgi:hypothetical protein
MYVIVERDSGRIFAFGPTPQKARTDFLRRDIWMESQVETHRCSPALYRQLKAAADDRFFYARCRINSKGVAVLRNDRVAVLPLGRQWATILRKG